MREIIESRKEFNSSMKPYIAMIVQTEQYPFSNDFFTENGLILPKKRVNYTPPPWVGVNYSVHFVAAYGRNVKPTKSREEIIPKINPSSKYLICDDYSAGGNTLEIAAIRLVEHGVKIDNIWGITQKGNSEIKDRVVLDRAIEWHNYQKRSPHMRKAMLEDLGFVHPSLDALLGCSD